MPYNVVKFRMEHFKTFDARKEQKADIAFLCKHPEFQTNWMYEIPIFTLMHNDKAILIYGMQTNGVGTYIPMVYAAEHIDKHRFAVVRCLYDYVEKFVGDDVRRFEAYVAVTDKKSCKLAKFFGFEPVGIRRQAAVDEQDQVIYERLWRK